MTLLDHRTLDEFFELFAHDPDVEDLLKRWHILKNQPFANGYSSNIQHIYDAAASRVEETLSTNGYQGELLDLHYELYREMESHLSFCGHDDRYDFIIVTPVADRPQHLQNCLNSLLNLCNRFTYGGFKDDKYQKITVVIADDSKHAENIARNKDIVHQYNRHGLDVHYFGQKEQLDALDRMSQTRRTALQGVLGNNPRHSFYHKGASITRNITYLKLLSIAKKRERILIWFLDSDQEFQVNTPHGKQPVYAINYFHRLNQIFSGSDIQMLTGKVVGDPPVSPAVMANNLLGDVTHFLSELAKADPRQECRFHQPASSHTAGASYHDMAELFGFQPSTESLAYHCTLDEPHDHIDCLTDFSGKLNRFFYGQHPTRQTHYEYQEFMSSAKPARTVYTGNYVLTPEALQYFIPFATLKLRMAGPVLGRLLKSELGSRFVSANIPMLHKRTVKETGRAEFRPGIDRDEEKIDLSGEFERQFYGDVMLFSMEKLTNDGYPHKPIAADTIKHTIVQTEAEMAARYSAKHAQILERLEYLKTLFDDTDNWWTYVQSNPTIKTNFQHFFRNMEHNFGPHAAGYHLIRSDSHRQMRLNEIFEAILRLPKEKEKWLEALSIYS